MAHSNLLQQIKADFPNFQFIESDCFYWSPKKNSIYYAQLRKNEESFWPLFHELGHAILGHHKFNSDFELLKLEIHAWQEARNIASNYDITVDENHVQDCLDTYRDWLYKRSTCPFCTTCAIQTTQNTYSCFNCNNTWQVSASRKCRTYRKKILHSQLGV